MEEMSEAKLIIDGILDNLSVSDLIHVLGEAILKEEHHNTLTHFIHYILQVVGGGFQNRFIVWYVEDDEKLIDTPIVEFDENNLWKELKTHEETDYVKTFDFVYDVFSNYFLTQSKLKSLETNLLQIDDIK